MSTYPQIIAAVVRAVPDVLPYLKPETVELAAKYDPSQPRDPKGSETGGQWTDEGGTASPFKDSKLKTVVYHGTNATFDKFDVSKTGSQTDAGFMGKGLYFSTDKRVASTFDKTVEVYVELKHPLSVEMTSFKQTKREIVTGALGLDKTTSPQDITAAAISQGYDGIILDYSPTGYNAKEIVIYTAEQTKINKTIKNQSPALKAASDLTSISASYHDAITQALVSFFEGGSVQSSRNQFRRAAVEALGGAFDVGYADGGGSIPADPDALEWLNARVEQEFGHIGTMYQQAKQIKKDGGDWFAWVTERADGYTRTAQSVYNAGRMWAMGNKVLTWHLGATEEHCDTCAELNGTNHRASWYIAHDYIPRKPGASMECGGYNCDCSLTDKKGETVTVGGAVKHMGPGPHPNGSPQSVHDGKFTPNRSETWDDGITRNFGPTPFPKIDRKVEYPKGRDVGFVTEKTVDLTSLYATQKEVVDMGLNLGPRENDLALVVRSNGIDYIQDGHHRLAAALWEGREKMKVRYLDLDKLYNK